MIKVLFVCYGLGLGGIEKCLVNLINSMPENRYDITLLLMNPEWDLKSDIKRNINYIDSFQYVMNTTDTFTEIQRRGGIIKNFGRFIDYCVFRLANKARLDVWKLFKPLPEKYDVAIAYSQNDFSPYYVMDKVYARRKVMWYHNGVYEGTGKKRSRDLRYYPQFDYVVSVSSDCKAVLQKEFTFDKNKLIILRNFCDKEMILHKADEFVPKSYNKDTVHIVTVGRMTKEKGASLVVEACEYLKEQKIEFCWHWVGDGNCKNQIVSEIERKGLKDCFIIEGNKTNPYPYIKNADLYVQPSFYEAYSTTITEAKILHKPIITTDVGGMRDQIEDGKNGIIVPIDAKEIGKAVKEILMNKKIQSLFVQRLKNESLNVNQLIQEYEKTVFRE